MVTEEGGDEMLFLNQIIPKEDLLDFEIDEEEDLEKENPWSNFVLNTPKDGKNLPDISQIAGDNLLKERTMKIIEKHKHVFSLSLPAQPAKVTPMRLKVDQEKWKIKRNMIKPRPLSIERSRQCKLQIEELTKSNVIEESRATYCSAVHMIPKPQSKEMRFTVDFRNLNDATEAERLHIPNIKCLLNEMGQTKPCMFAKLDLTKGYYQMPLEESSKELTAFTSHAGTFQWNRIPMGLKGAAG
jgi:hypothetical protein